MIIALAVVFLAGSPPVWIRGAGIGAGAAVAAVAVRAGVNVAGPIWNGTAARRRSGVLFYALAGGIAAATAGPWLVLVLLGAGAIELTWRGLARGGLALHLWPLAAAVAPAGTGALAWTALKVGALAFGGGFVSVPLTQSDAVSTYHWMTHAQFLKAVPLGQVTPGPVVGTVAVVGYAAAGFPGAALAAFVAFAPSFSFILFGAAHFERLLPIEHVTAFLAGAAPAAAGAIIGSAATLATALSQTWQYGFLAVSAVVVVALRRSVVLMLIAAGVAGAAARLLGAPV